MAFLLGTACRVGLGANRPKFVFWMHFIKPPYTVGAFSAGIALVLILVTATIGYVAGYVLGVLWNAIHR